MFTIYFHVISNYGHKYTLHLATVGTIGHISRNVIFFQNLSRNYVISRRRTQELLTLA
jgi:hypothetical protein